MSRNEMIDRLTKLGEQTISQAAVALGKNRALTEKLETVVKSGMAVKDEVEGNVKVVLDRINLKNPVDVDGIKSRLDALESDIEGLIGDLSGRVSELTRRVAELRGRIAGEPANDAVEVTVVEEAPVVEEPASELGAMTVKALRDLAATRGIEVPSRIRKADLIELIEAA